jgi:hypothetical protein
LLVGGHRDNAVLDADVRGALIEGDDHVRHLQHQWCITRNCRVYFIELFSRAASLHHGQAPVKLHKHQILR